MNNWVRQAAAIPLHEGRVCMVTSSRGHRWVIPKGMIDPGETAGETALKESWEEAGIAGSLRAEPVGSYVYEKYGSLCHVTVFVMHVTQVHEHWPESDRRSREFVELSAALDRIEEEGLRDILDRSQRTLMEECLAIARSA
jgi:8-oxo-dGTP pyrophosphatase MutT (NUDIX family)